MIKKLIASSLIFLSFLVFFALNKPNTTFAFNPDSQTVVDLGKGDASVTDLPDSSFAWYNSSETQAAQPAVLGASTSVPSDEIAKPSINQEELQLLNQYLTNGYLVLNSVFLQQ